MNNQTFKDFELICVNDGSTDGSVELINQFKTHYSVDLILIEQDNLGAGVARNAGIKIARGDYFLFLDSDDLLESTALEEAYSTLSSSNSDMLIFQCDLFDDFTAKKSDAKWALRDEYLHNKNEISPTELGKYIFQFCNGWAIDKLFRKSLIVNNGIKFQNTHFFNDTFFVFSTLLHSESISILRHVLIHKRLNSGENQISLNRSTHWLDFYDVVSSIHSELLKIECSELQIQSAINYYVHIALVMLDTTTSDIYDQLVLFIRNTYIPKLKIILEPDYYYNKREYTRFYEICKTIDVTPVSRDNYKVLYYNNLDSSTDLKFGDYIPIVLAADNNYHRQMFVTLVSILQNKKESSKYIVYMLMPELFSNEKMAAYRILSSKYENFELRAVVMGDVLSGTDMSIKHITYITYYRILIPEIIPFKKCIYLDVDLIVRCDLTDLFCVDLNNNLLAGVKAPVYICKKDGNLEYCKLLGIESIGQYINAGVLVINVDLFRKEGLKNKMISLIPKHFPSQDQDILNVVAYGRIKNVDCKYNVMTKYNLEDYNRLNQLISVYGLKSAVDAYRNPFIVHYADKNKPWNDVNCIFAEMWWHYCSMTPYFIEMFKKLRYKRSSTEDNPLFDSLMCDLKEKGLMYYIRLFAKEIRK